MTAASQASFSVKIPPKKPTNAERRSREYLTRTSDSLRKKWTFGRPRQRTPQGDMSLRRT